MAIDGSKFKAVNNRDRNFTAAKMKRRMAQIEESVGRYLHQLDSADRQAPSLAQAMRTTRLTEKIERLKEEMGRLEALEAERRERPDQQISLTDPDARSMATSGRGSGTVGYNVQAAVDIEHHLIVTHEVTNVGHDRAQLSPMAKQTKATLEVDELDEDTVDKAQAWDAITEKNRENARLRAALVEAKRTIKALHGPVSWDIYEKHSPEMKKINAALGSVSEASEGGSRSG